MKIAACIILYRTDKTVTQNIQSYIKHIERFYLIDNSESIINELHKGFAYLSHTQIIHNGINEGIAKRLNQACDLAIKDGFDYLLTMDQDSYFDESHISKYFECIETIKEKNVSLFGVNYQQKQDEINCKYNEVKFLITSGSIINLKSYQNIGGFDENLFIDFVDTEFCFRSIEKGYRIIEFSNIYMHHSLGKSVQKYSLKNFKKTNRSFHPPIRLYYMLRNFLYLRKKYNKAFPKEITTLKKDLLNRIKNSLIYKSNRLIAIKFLLRAINHFMQNKMGKLSD